MKTLKKMNLRLKMWYRHAILMTMRKTGRTAKKEMIIKMKMRMMTMVRTLTHPKKAWMLKKPIK